MPKASPALLNFNAGEISPLWGRVDIGKYNAGCNRLENFIPLIQGPARRRSGTRFVKPVRNSANRTFLTRFVFSATQAYILEWGDQYLRFYTNHGALLEAGKAITAATQASPCQITSTAHGFSTGDQVYISGVAGMTPLNGHFFTVTVIDANNFTLNGIDSTGYPAYSAAGTAARVYTVTTPYTAANLTDANGIFQLNIAQTGDVAYIAHAGGLYAPYKLSRLGNTNWTLVTLNAIGGPFKDEDPDQTITMYASAATGAVTITASAAAFQPGHVGALLFLEAKQLRDVKTWEVGKAVATNDIYRVGFRVYQALTTGFTGGNVPTHTVGSAWDGTATTTPGASPYVSGVNWKFLDPSYGWVQITGYTSPTVVSANVLSTLDGETVGAGNATTKWALGAWSDVEGWPTNVIFFRTRLCWARGQNLWFSEAGDFEKYRARNEGGEVTADMAISIVIPSQDPIRWMAEANKLLVGTSGAEHSVGEITTTDPLGPANIQSVQVLPYGGRNIPALRIDDSIIFVQISGHKLREIKYSFQVDNFISADLAALAPHIAGTGFGFIAMAWQQEPNFIVWLARTDGQLVGFTFNREQDVTGFHRHILGGIGVYVESIACIPAPSGDRDETWLVVRRTIGGAVVRYVEFIEDDFQTGDAIADAFFVDAGLTYSGAAANTISGLDHLVGQTVDVLADGSAHRQLVVAADGSITLDRNASKAQIGLPCPCVLETMRIEAGAADGTAQGKTKRLTNVTMRFQNTLGGKVGSPATLEQLSFRTESNQMDQPVPLFTGDWRIAYPEGYEQDAIIHYENSQPLPVTLVALWPQLETQDRG